MAGKPKGLTIPISADMANVNNAFTSASNNAKKLTAEMKAVERALKLNPGNVELLSQKSQIAEERVKELSKTLSILKETQEQAATGFDFHGNKLNDEQIRLANREYLNAAAGFEKALYGAAEAAENAGKKTSLFWEIAKASAAGSLAASAVKSFARELKNLVKSAPEAAIEFESAFAGVLKTVDGTAEQLSGLRNGIRRMALEIPSSATEIAAVAEAAGQLGIETDNVLNFTKVMIGLSEATNLTSDAAASALAKFANITRMPQQDFDRLGSTVVSLGNTFATTEADIVNMSSRLASAGTQAGLSNAQIMGLSAAMSSMGIEAEAGGTAMSKTLVMIQKAVELGGDELLKYADVAGMSAEEFRRAWEKDAAGALVKFIAGLSRFKNEGKSAVVVLDELGIKEARQSNALRSLTGNYGLLEKAIKDAETSWSENAALTEETQKRYQTTESQLVLMKNAFNDLGITIGEAVIPAIREFSEDARDFVSDNKDGISEIADGFGKAALLIVNNADMLKNALLSLGAAFAFSKSSDVVRKLGDAANAINAARLAAEASGKSVSALSGALGLIGGPAGAAAAGVAAVTFAALEYGKRFPPIINQTAEYTKELSQTVNESKKLTKAISDQQKAFDGALSDIKNQTAENARLSDEIYALAEAELAAAKAGEAAGGKRAVLLEKIEQLNSAVPGLALAYDAESGALSRAKEETDKYLESKERELTFQAYMEAQLDVRRQMVEIETQLAALEREREALRNAPNKAERETQYQIAEARRKEAIEKSIRAENELREQYAEREEQYKTLGATAEKYADTAVLANGKIVESEKEVAAVKEEDIEAEQERTRQLEEEKKKQEEIQASYASHTQNIFGQIKEEAAVSIDTLISNLEKNQQKIKAWTENLALLADEGIDEGLLAKLREAGPEAAKTVEGLVGASGEKLEKLNEVFKNGSKEAVDAMMRELGLPEVTNAGADTLDDIADAIEKNKAVVTAVTNTVVNAKSALTDKIAEQDFTLSGKNIALGMARGILAGESEVINASVRLANSALNASKKALDERSPSKKMAEIGENAAIGFANGVDNEKERVKDAGGGMAAEFTATAYAELIKGKARLEAGLSQMGSAKGVQDAKKAIEAELKEIDAQLKDKRDNFIKYGEAVTQAVKNQALERYEAEKEALKEELAVFKNVKYDEKALLQDYSYDFKRINEDGLSLIEDLTGERIRLVSQSYIDEIALIDEKTALALKGVNDEIERELEKLFITNQGLYQEIAAIREKKRELSEAHEAELKRREEEAEAKRLAELQKRIAEAETIEAQIAAHEEMREYLRQLDEKAADERFREELLRLEAEERERIESARRVAEEAKAVQDAYLKDAEAALADGEKAYDAEKAGIIKARYDEAVSMAASVAAELLKETDAGRMAVKELLESYNPDWAMAGKAFVEHFEAGVSEMEQSAVETLYDLGDNTISGFIDGLLDKENEVRDAVRRILAEAAKVAEATLDIHSPSRVFREIGLNAGAGFEYGLLDAAPFIEKAAATLGVVSVKGVSDASDVSGAGINNSVTNNEGDIHLHVNVGSVNNSGGRDIQDFSEELSFLIKRQLRGVGA